MSLPSFETRRDVIALQGVAMSAIYIDVVPIATGNVFQRGQRLLLKRFDMVPKRLNLSTKVGFHVLGCRGNLKYVHIQRFVLRQYPIDIAEDCFRAGTSQSKKNFWQRISTKTNRTTRRVSS